MEYCLERLSCLGIDALFDNNIVINIYIYIYIYIYIHDI